MTDVTSAGRVGLSGSRFGAAPYAFTIFLSAALVFLVQPMFAKMAMPVLGGSPSVWNVSLVCFQAALLGGYVYAHLLARLKNTRLQVVIHGTALLAAAVVLPFGLTTALGAPNPSAPTLWLAGAFALSIAPPFMVISATAPLIQAWYGRSGRHDAADPYYLYAASNVGSLIGLCAYPLLMEPLMPLASQTATWSMGYGLLAFALVSCGLLAWASGRDAAPAAASPLAAEVSSDEATNVWTQRLKWLALAFIPSSLLVGATTHISTDVAAAPFLWAPPLIVYIASFIVVFSKAGDAATDFSTKWLPLVVGAVLVFLSGIIRPPILLAFGLNLGALALASLMCHGLMARTRPEVGRLTEFYLIMSLGGVLGGAFNALVAPVIFNSVIEYPLVLVLVLLARPAEESGFSGPNRVMALIAIAMAVVAAALTFATNNNLDGSLVKLFLLAPVIIMALTRTNRFAPAIAALAIGGVQVQPVLSGTSVSERSFFGVVRIEEKDGYRKMMHGTTLHGTQRIEDVARPQPLTYYHEEAPIGQIFQQWQDAETVGVLGLGVGSVACYLTPEQKAVFFEIDPLVAKVAADETQFQFLSNCAPDMPVVLGDGRLTIQDQPEGVFDLLLIDAFSSDSVPAHLITREALQVYFSRVAEDGVVVFHVSNNYLALEKVLARIAGADDLVAKYQFFRAHKDRVPEVTSSQVVILARSEAAFARLAGDDRWEPLVSDGKRPWTDDYTNIVGSMLEH